MGEFLMVFTFLRISEVTAILALDRMSALFRFLVTQLRCRAGIDSVLTFSHSFVSCYTIQVFVLC